MPKQNKPPKYHHYVPKTYLKHWLDEDNLIYIYDKKSGKIRSSSINGQYFGKNNLNTITYPDSSKGYWVEEAYAEVEGIITPVLNKIASSLLSESRNITYDDKLMLSLFVSVQFWRLPANRSLVDDLIKNGELSSIGLSARTLKTGKNINRDDAKSFYEYVASTDLFQKAYPALRSLLDLTKKDAFDELSAWSFYFQEPGHHLTSDSPILYIKEPDINSIFTNFILPISPGVLLVSNKYPPESISSFSSTDLNILQIRHAHQFVAGTNEAYLRTLVNEYEQRFKSIPVGALEGHVYSKIFSNIQCN